MHTNTQKALCLFGCVSLSRCYIKWHHVFSQRNNGNLSSDKHAGIFTFNTWSEHCYRGKRGVYELLFVVFGQMRTNFLAFMLLLLHVGWRATMGTIPVITTFTSLDNTKGWLPVLAVMSVICTVNDWFSATELQLCDSHAVEYCISA